MTVPKHTLRSLLLSAIGLSLMVSSCNTGDDDDDGYRRAQGLSHREWREMTGDLLARLDSASQTCPTFYQAKNVVVTMSDAKGRSFKGKLDLTLRPGGKSRVAARLSFPPMVLGMVEGEGNTFRLTSKLAHIDTVRTVKFDPVPSFVQLLCGIVPGIYMRPDSTGNRHFRYELSDSLTRVNRDVLGYHTSLELGGRSLRMEGFEANNDTLYGSLQVMSRQLVGPRMVPAQLRIIAYKGERKLGTLEMDLGEVKIEW